jgi:hypothetical protein
MNAYDLPRTTVLKKFKLRKQSGSSNLQPYLADMLACGLFIPWSVCLNLQVNYQHSIGIYTIESMNPTKINHDNILILMLA